MRPLLALLIFVAPAFCVSIERLPETRVRTVVSSPRALPELKIPGAAPSAVLPDLAAPGLAAPQTPAAAPIVPVLAQALPRAGLSQALEPTAAAVAADVQSLGRASGESAAGAGESEIRLLQGGAPAPPPSAALAAPPRKADESLAHAVLGPAPVSDESRRAVKLIMTATPAFKLGTEVVTLSMPLLVMKSLGGATIVAALVIVFQAAQAAAGAITPELLKRFSASKVLAGSNLIQAVLVGGFLGLAAAHLAAPWLLFPVYGLSGLAAGVADTSRRVIPALLMGRDEQALRDYNARLHRRYEAAGVVGSLAGGALIALVGPLYAMLIQPPAYLLSAWLLMKVKLPVGAAARQEGGSSWKDVLAGAKRVVGDPRFRWLAAAMVLPQVIHRIFENLLLPVYAKTLLGAGALAAVLLTASNLGELGGASLLLKKSARFPGPSAWVRWAALGLLAGWALPLAGHLPLALALGALVPLIFVFSSTWAASHLSLESDVQKHVSEKDQPGVMGFLNALFIGATALASFGLGRLLDAAGTGPALLWICGGFSAVGSLLWLAARRFKARP